MLRASVPLPESDSDSHPLCHVRETFSLALDLGSNGNPEDGASSTRHLARYDRRWLARDSIRRAPPSDGLSDLPPIVGLAGIGEARLVHPPKEGGPSLWSSLDPHSTLESKDNSAMTGPPGIRWAMPVRHRGAPQTSKYCGSQRLSAAINHDGNRFPSAKPFVNE